MVQLPLPRHRYTRWTAERMREVTRLWNAGTRVTTIAEALGVTPKAVYKKVWTLRGQGTQKRRAGRPRKEVS